jgi:hypothetical protein
VTSLSTVVIAGAGMSAKAAAVAVATAIAIARGGVAGRWVLVIVVLLAGA